MRQSQSACLLGTALLAGVIGCLAVGCNYSLPPQADPAKARETLKVALEAWQNGETVEGLAAQRPPIYVHDDDWQKGAELLSFERTGDGDRFGLNHSCPVVLSLKSKNGKTVQKKVHYSITTSPALTITREDRRSDS